MTPQPPPAPIGDNATGYTDTLALNDIHAILTTPAPPPPAGAGLPSTGRPSARTARASARPASSRVAALRLPGPSLPARLASPEN